MKKVYQSLRSLNFSTTVEVGGTRARIEFTNGKTQPHPRKGTFVTSDEELQKAIEADPSYGKEFNQLYPPVEKKAAKAKKEKPATEPAKEGDVSEVKGTPKEEKPIATPVLEPQNVSQAKKWLLENVEGTKTSDLPNKQGVIDYALSKGYFFPALEV